jgi:hypothetical protein
MENNSKIKWYDKKGLVLFLTIFVWPLGLIGLYLSKSLTKFQKFLYVIGAIIFVTFFINVLVPSLQSLRHNPESNAELPEDPRPSDQKQFEDRAWEFIKSFAEAEKNENDLKMSQIETSSINFFRQQIVVQKWSGRFSSLTTIGEYSRDSDDDFHIIWVTSQSGFKYSLKMTRLNEKLNNYLANIEKGAEIVFSGLATQDALTPDRMVHQSDPSYEVNCTQIGDVVIGNLDELKDPNGNLRIGQLYDGGIIIKVSNGHGLMIAPEDLDHIKGYSNHKPADGGGYLGTYTWDETMDILNNFNYNGHNDWRLPTKDEWELIDNQKHNSDYNLGTFYGFIYWASDEGEDALGRTSEAYQKNVGGSSNYQDGFMDKSSWGYVRFIRNF